MSHASSRETQWIEWTRSALQPRERVDLATSLTAEQSEHLLAHDYVWGPGIGIVWRSEKGGPEQRAGFTHGMHFRTRHGEFYVDAEGGVRPLSPTV